MRDWVDLIESYDGDLIADRFDLADTSNERYKTYYQILRLLLNSEPGDYWGWPEIGLDLSIYMGRPNTPELGYEIAHVVKQYLLQFSPLFNYEFDVEPYPLGRESLALWIHVNTLDDTEGISIVYDLMDNNLKSMKQYENNIRPAFVIKDSQPTINRRET